MINKITMKSVASYKKIATLETDKKVNLLYGLNGTGKSTLSDFFYNKDDSRYANCSIEGLKATDEILVYNQQFIKDNFYETEDIPGIFTLSKENKEIKVVIEQAKKSLLELRSEKENLDKEKLENKSKFEKETAKFQEEAWKIKTEYSGGDRVLEFCLEGYKNKKNLFDYLVSLDKSLNNIDYTTEDLKKEATLLQNGGVKEHFIDKISINVDDIEKSELLQKAIVGNKNSSVADLIDKLNNSDWVKKGMDYLTMDEGPDLCPFCQEKTITKDFIKQIIEYFDESYLQDIRNLEDLFSLYSEKTSSLISKIETITENKFMENTRKEIDTYLIELKKKIEHNLEKIRTKIETPSTIIILESFEDLILSVNTIIENVNERISDYNNKIENIKDSKNKIKEKFWKLMRAEFDALINIYNERKEDNKNYEDKITKEEEELNKKIEKQKMIIKENQKKTINIDEAIENIRIALLDIGISEFAIEKYSEQDALYHLKRKDCEDSNVFHTLSEGEKMIISFLYFLERCKGNTKVDSTLGNKIIVIDDPISSLSHIHVFNIGRLIQNEFLKNDKYEQIFILTHSLYFFYELTNIKHVEREKTQKLFRVIKNNDGSSISTMKYDEIQNDYQSYWQIVKDKNQPAALIANCMRNIIEYFFNFVEKQDLNNVFQKKELQQVKFMAFNRYMNRESHSKGQNIFDIKEFDYNDFKKAFELVFLHTGYEEHYKKMIE